MATRTLDRVRETTDGTDLGKPWRVILYNDDWHTFKEVVVQVQRAAKCLEPEALAITYEAHTTGRVVAYTGPKAECDRALGVLREIRLQAELDEG